MTLDEYLLTDARYRQLVRAATKASESRSRLPPGSSRARVTTANSRWARAAEARDRRERELREQWGTDSGSEGT